MTKIILNKDEYVFNPTSGTIQVLAKVDIFTKERLLLITNTTSNTIIYNFACVGHGGDIVNDTLTLEYDVLEMLTTDDLQILLYDDLSNDARTIVSALQIALNMQNSCLASIEEGINLTNTYLKSISN